MSCSARGTQIRHLVLVLSAAGVATASHTARAINLPLAGVNASTYAYYGTTLPFLDVAHMGDRWNSVPSLGANLSAPHDIPLTADDYPASLAPGEIARSLIFTGNGGIYPTGLYQLRWSGSGQVQLTAPGMTVVSSQPSAIAYRVSATNPNGIMLDITATNPANPVRNISVRAPFPATNGSAFNQLYKNDLANYGVIRYMGWGLANNSKVQTWSQRTSPSDAFWGGPSGVPYEMQIQLSNETKEDLWLTVPHMADDNFVRNLAALVRQRLAPGLRVWVEYSNEVWNGGFQQFRYASEALQPRYGLPNSAQAYGRRSAEIFDIFSTQITDPKKLVRVIAGQNANSWVLDQSLIGATVNGQVKADVAAVAPYFLPDIDKLYEKHQSGTVNLDDVFSELRSSIDSVITSAQHNRDVAAARGLPLVAYEGGQHLVARPGDQHNNQGFVDLLVNINRDPRMGDLYKYMLDKWYAAGGKTFVFPAEAATPGKWGSWGLKENYLDNDAVKFRAVQDYLKALQNPADINKDGAVDSTDYELWRSSFGSGLNLSADVNRDGIVDGGDYLLWRKSVSTGSAAAYALSHEAGAVPEPSTLLLFAEMACIGLIKRFST